MRKLILQEWLSIDGFAADADGKLDFFSAPELHIESDQDLLKEMDNIDTILLGATTYKLFVDFWPTAATDQEIIADKLNLTSKIVFSKTLEHAPWGRWPEAKVVTTDAAEAIRKFKKQPGKNMVMWGSISLAQTLMKENLIDELRLGICPVAIGSGSAFFPSAQSPMQLRLLAAKQYTSGLVSLTYLPNNQK